MQSASPVHGQNQWPSHSPAFEAALRQYISGCLSIGQAVMRGMLQDISPSVIVKLGITAGDYLCMPKGLQFCHAWPDHGLCCNAGIAQGLGLQDDFFESKAGGLTNAESSYWVTRVIHYPPLQEVRCFSCSPIPNSSTF